MRKNITLNAEESLIKRAREVASRQHRSLNTAFREWLVRYVGADKAKDGYDQLMQKLRHVEPGRKFSREEMNDR
jgi:hypothetical protein